VIQPPPGSSPPPPSATSLAQASVPWAAVAAHSADADSVLFVRVIARRNFVGFPFWVACPPETCARLATVYRAQTQARGFDAGLTLAAVSPTMIGVLRERMYLPERPASFPGKRDFKQWTPGVEAGEHALFGETEQWTHVRMALHNAAAELTTPSALSTIFDRAAAIATEFARDQENSAFARSDAFGFLTSNPSYAGLGLQLEAGLHVPALAARRHVPQIRQALAAMGCELQPLSMREPGTADAGYFRLLSRGGLDLTSEDLVARFAEQVNMVLRAETETMQRWRTHEPDVLDDRMHRAIRVLQEARHMEGPELHVLTSWARAGVYADLFPRSLLAKLETLRVTSQPFHLVAAGEVGGSVVGPSGSGGPEGSTRPNDSQTPSGSPRDSQAVLRAVLARRLLSEG
jgi:hypothetical protein